MKKMHLKIVIALVISELITGCGTISSLYMSNNIDARREYFYEAHFGCKEPSESVKIPHIYSGTMTRYLSIPWMSNCGWGHGEQGMIDTPIKFILSPLLVIDLAVSFTLDTAMLPVTIPLQYKNGNIIDPPYFALGKIAEAKSEYSKATYYYEKGIQALPKYFTKPICELAVGFNPLYIEHALRYLAEYYSDNKDYSKSISYYNILIEARSRSKLESPAFYYREVADVYRKMGNEALFKEYINKSYNIEELPKIKQFIETLSKGRYDEGEFSNMLSQKRIDVRIFFNEAGDKNSELNKVLAENNVVIEKKAPDKAKGVTLKGEVIEFIIDKTPFYYVITKK